MGGSSNQGFTEKQAEEILKRALDLQARVNATKMSTNSEGGVTLDELYRSAAEIGVDPDLVRQAVQEKSGRSIRFSKSDPPAPALIEREFPVRVSEADYPALLEYLRSETRTSGGAQVVGGTLEWTGFMSAAREMLHVVVAPAGDSTLVRIRSTNPLANVQMGAFKFFPLLFLIIGFVPAAFSGFHLFQWSMLIPFAVIAAFGILIPNIMFLGRFRKKADGRGEALMDSVALWMQQLQSSREIG